MAKCKGRLNPPTRFTEHEAAIKKAFTDAGFPEPEVLYGLGPSAEIGLPGDSLDDAAIPEFARLAERLRTDDATRFEVLSVVTEDPGVIRSNEILVTAEQRDEVEDGGTPARYDQGAATAS